MRARDKDPSASAFYCFCCVSVLCEHREALQTCWWVYEGLNVAIAGCAALLLLYIDGISVLRLW